MSCLAPPQASAATPNDPSFQLQWADSNTGQSIPTQSAEGEETLGPPAPGTPGADERALAAWEVTTGSRSIVIGELDTGVQYTHPDLAANIWSNPGGIGGCPEGTHGFDAVNGTCNPEDEDERYGGHGTHVAGIMGAVGNNRVGVAGLNWETSILPVKWVQSAGSESEHLLAALKWLVTAKEEGVNIRVVNDSLTFFGTLYSPEVKSEIEVLGQHGILFVTAAGNTRNNNDEEAVRRYPCGYDLPNELCVTATNNNDELAPWANWGAHTVNLAAPGVSIYSTLRGGRYGYLSGGSMASAQVAGAAALILSSAPNLTVAELRAAILSTVRPLPALKGLVISGGTLDICRAMPACQRPPLPSVSTREAVSLTQTSASLEASVNPNGREVSDCHFEYGTTSAYGQSAQCIPMPGRGTRPVEVSARLNGLSPNTSYHFRIVATGAAGTSVGSDATFTTPPEPPGIAAFGASSITQTSASLTASVDPNGARVVDCRFEYGRTSAYGESAPCVPSPGAGTAPVEVSASLVRLSPNATYHFRVVASNAGGGSVSPDATFTTPPDAPGVVSKSASEVTASSATLNALVDPEGAPVSSCFFEYGSTSGYGSSVPCASPPGAGDSLVAVSAAIAGLGPNTTYHFRIVASNPGGTSHGADQSVTTPPNAPAVVSEAASSVTLSSAVLNATVNPNGAAVSSCRFEYGLTSSYGHSIACGSLPGAGEAPAAVSATLTGLALDTTYHFRIVASNGGGTSAGKDRAFTSLPEPPAVLTGPASEVEANAATLTATVDPNGAAVGDCHFEYGTTSALGATATCTSVPGSGTEPVAVSAHLTELTARTTYYFRISAASAGGSSDGSEESFTTTGNPAVLTGAAASVTRTSATLMGSVNPNGGEVTDCHFEYGASSTYGKNVPCAPMPGGASSPARVSASIAGLTPGTTYHFRLLASNADGTTSGADQTLTTERARAEEAPASTQPLPSALQLAPVAPGGQLPGAQASPLRALVPSLLVRTLTVSASGRLRVALACPPGLDRCSGRLIVRALLATHPVLARGHPLRRGSPPREIVIASAHYAIGPRESVLQTLSVSLSARRLLATAPRLAAEAVLLADAPAGTRPAAGIRVTLLASREARAQRRAP